jgi:hypothetical protein
MAMKDTRSFAFGMSVVPIALLGIGIAIASSVNTPNVFVPGTPVVAAQVNANFAAHEAAIDDNDARITVLENALGGSDLVRASYIEDTAFINDFTGGPTVVLSNPNVVAPVAGILLVWGTLNIEWDIDSGAGTFADMTMRVLVDGTPVTGQGVQVEVKDEGFNNDSQTMSISGAIAVGAGTRVVDMDLDLNGVALAFIEGRTLTTLFVPFGNSGTQGVLARTAGPSDDDGANDPR